MNQLDKERFCLPGKVLVLGYGAIGKCFVDILLKEYPEVNLLVCDIYDFPSEERVFKYLKKRMNKENLHEIFDILQSGDMLIDLSTNIDCVTIWSLCMKKGVMYMNLAMEEWEDSENPNSFPKSLRELYKTTLGYRHDRAKNSGVWNSSEGTTSVFEHGFNPGLISNFVKKGLIEAGNYFLRNRKEYDDLNFEVIQAYLKENNYSKLAQALGLHTIHCSEIDNQKLVECPKDLRSKFYNTWSCRGFLTESLVPIQVAKGSHEDDENEEFPRLTENSVIMSWAPSKNYSAKSWVPFQNIEGVIIPHGEAYTIHDFLSDKETGYSPSQYYVYDYNPYAREFISNLPKDITVQECNPEMQVLHPKNHNLQGYDKVGALLIFNKNRGWWSGSIMDDIDASMIMNHKYGPTVLQVSGGVFSAFLWMCKNPKAGNKWAENLDSDFVIRAAKPYLGRIYSDFVDLSKTNLKDCYKFESFITKKYSFHKK